MDIFSEPVGDFGGDVSVDFGFNSCGTGNSFRYLDV
jgi:hypothetical protein